MITYVSLNYNSTITKEDVKGDKKSHIKMLKCHYSTLWSMKNVAVMTVDGAFALFLRPHPLVEFAIHGKKILMPGVSPGWRVVGGAGSTGSPSLL